MTIKCVIIHFNRRYGRRTILLISLFLASFAGVVQSFSINYTMFIICEICCAVLTCPTFTAALILGLEWAGSSERVIVNSIITFPLHFGIALIGVLASFVQDFRPLLRMVYGPAFVTGILVCLGPESFRWLMAKGKREPIDKILKRAAHINKRQLAPRSYAIVDQNCGEAAQKSSGNSSDGSTNNDGIRTLFTSRTLVMRAMINALCWITGNYVSQGITIIAVSLQGDKYWNFIILAIGGVPSPFISIILLRFVGRRSGISICLIAASFAVILGKLLPTEHSNYALACFLIARCFVMVAYLICYVHTSELWPTPFRHTMVFKILTGWNLGSACFA